MTPYETCQPADVDDLDQVASHADAAHVVEQMLADLRAHPDAWENPTLDGYLEALAALLGSLPSMYTNRGEQLPPPSWKLFTQALVAATGYE